MKKPIEPKKLAPVASLLFKAWVRTLNIRDQGAWKKVLRNQKGGHRFVLCLWHEEIFTVAGYGYTKTKDLVTFASRSRDGDFTSIILHSLGHATVRGSSSKGGIMAVIRAKRIMERENRMAVFTIDGPRGPRRVPKNGPIFLAQLTGAKIVPLRAFPKKKYILHKSWDRFQLPHPFTLCRIRVGTPYEVTRQKLTASVLQGERGKLRREMQRLKP